MPQYDRARPGRRGGPDLHNLKLKMGETALAVKSTAAGPVSAIVGLHGILRDPSQPSPGPSPTLIL